MSLTQYLASQEDQDMTRLLNFTRTQERRRGGGGFVCFEMKERGRLYSSGGENMKGRPFNEGGQRIMNLVLILALGEIWCIKWKDW